MVILNRQKQFIAIMDMTRYTPSEQVGNVEDDYLTPSSDIPYYINLAITGHNGIIVPFKLPITTTD